MKKVVTFGEIMMRLQPPSFEKIVQAQEYRAYFGGSEANTAVALAQWGIASSFVTKLPENQLGDACVRALRSWGVDPSGIVRGRGRMGLYFTERGASQRPPEIVYDREYSAFSQAAAGDFDFSSIMEGADWFHFSGITPALGDGPAKLTLSAVSAAREKGLKISCDLNFRSKLWTAAQAVGTMSPLIEGIDLLILNENQAGEVFGISGETLEETARLVAERFRIRTVAVTKRRTVSGEVNEFSALLSDAEGVSTSRTWSIFMIDKIGGGDAFSAGLIYGFLTGKSRQDTVEYAAAAACYKHTVEGDMLAASVAEIERLVRSDGTGRLVR